MQLRAHLLPKKFDPTGTYSDRVLDRARGFRLLAHAEFESYIEDRVLEVAQSRFDDWASNRIASRCVIGLLAYHERPDNANPLPPPTPISSIPAKGKQSPELEGRVRKAKNAFDHYVRTQNNGVKEENLLRMLMWVGVESNELDATWLASMTSFGEARGELAHKSGQKIQTPPDPLREYKTVRLLLDGFKYVDSVIERV